eukprot:evm.model.scf_1638.2 EVM.evm.TU.scf_1638.2   scf_1638:17370-23436(+)
MTPNGPFRLDNCPIQIDAQQVPVVLYAKAPRDVEEVRGLLQWFHMESSRSSEKFPEGDTLATLSLPASLSKGERATWHHIALDLGLGSMSKGTGAERFVMIFTVWYKAQGWCELELTKEKWEEAVQIWQWCQMEKGPFASISRFEVGEMMLSEGGLREDVRELANRMGQAKQAADCLRRADMSGASVVFADNRDVVWCRDEESGGYPIHLACWMGMTELVAWLAQFPGMVQVKDGSDATPIDIASARGHHEIVGILLQNGARGVENGRAAQLTYLHHPRYNSFKSDEHRDEVLYGKPPSMPQGSARGGRGRFQRGGRAQGPRGRGWRMTNGGGRMTNPGGRMSNGSSSRIASERGRRGRGGMNGYNGRGSYEGGQGRANGYGGTGGQAAGSGRGAYGRGNGYVRGRGGRGGYGREDRGRGPDSGGGRYGADQGQQPFESSLVPRSVRLKGEGGAVASGSGSGRGFQVNADGSYYNDEMQRYEWRDGTTGELYVWNDDSQKYLPEAQVVDGGTSNGAAGNEGGDAKAVWNEATGEWEYPGYPGWRWNEATQAWEQSDRGGSSTAAVTANGNVGGACNGDAVGVGTSDLNSRRAGAATGEGSGGGAQNGCMWDEGLQRWLKDGWSYNEETREWEAM